MRRAFVVLAAMVLTGSAMTAAAQSTAGPSVLVQLAKLQTGSLPRSITTFGTIETSPAFPHTTPARTSLWPARYFVALCTTRSIPNDAGRQFTGVANVASIIDLTVRCDLQAAASRSRSTHARYGFVGDSLKTSRVSGRTAPGSESRSPAARSV